MVAVCSRLLAAVLLSYAGTSLATEFKEDLALIWDSNRVSEVNTGEVVLQDTHVNELSLALTLAIRLYQSVISSQDIPACNFTQSCSRFGFESIGHYGPVHGILMTSDRLQRCNAFSRRYYPQDAVTGLAIDHPSDWYHLH